MRLKPNNKGSKITKNTLNLEVDRFTSSKDYYNNITARARIWANCVYKDEHDQYIAAMAYSFGFAHAKNTSLGDEYYNALLNATNSVDVTKADEAIENLTYVDYNRWDI